MHIEKYFDKLDPDWGNDYNPNHNDMVLFMRHKKDITPLFNIIKEAVKQSFDLEEFKELYELALDSLRKASFRVYEDYIDLTLFTNSDLELMKKIVDYDGTIPSHNDIPQNYHIKFTENPEKYGSFDKDKFNELLKSGLEKL